MGSVSAVQGEIPARMAGALPVPMYRMNSSPLRGTGNPDSGHLRESRSHLVSALTGAHIISSPVAVCWIRIGPQRQISVLVGPSAMAAGEADTDGRTRLIYPPGSEGRELGQEEIASLVRRIGTWVRCSGSFDPLGAESSDSPQRQSWGSLEECFAYLSHAALAWVVIAHPVGEDRIGEMREQLAYRLPEQRNRASTSESHRLALERDEAWYRELERGQSAGMWSISAIAGAANAADALRIATLLCNTADVRELPYRFRPEGRAASLADAVRETVSRDGAPSFPFIASSELVGAVARPPEREIPGIRLIRPPPFDVTSESSGPFRLGDTLDESLRSCGRLSVSGDTLNRHAFVCGATGSGKSQTVRTLLESLSSARIPWLVIEPAKAEYATGMAGRLKDRADVVVIRVGDPALIPGSLNPLEPEPGFPLQSHADMVRALFLAAFDADEPFPQVLSYALTRCYERSGWDLALSRPALAWSSPAPPRYPSLGDVQEAAKQVVGEIGYGKEVTDNVRGFVDVRIRSLRTGSPGRFFEGGHPLSMRDLMRKHVVFEMEDVANDQDKAFLIGVVLIRLFEHLRTRARQDATPGLKHVTVVEEAHRLLRRVDERGPASQAVELFANLLAEIRAYGEGIVIAEQIPSKVIPDLIKNTALKVVHRLPAQDDRQAVGATMNLSDEQSEYVVTLLPGRAAIFADGMDRPVLSSIAYGEEREGGIPEFVPPLAGRRSQTCGPSCQARACTLEEIRSADELASAEPGLRLWIELCFVSHLTGESTTGPDDQWLRRFPREDERRMECAVSHLAQRATECRYTHLKYFFAPEGLAEHVAQLVLHRLHARKGANACHEDEVEWRAGTRRWLDVRRALRYDEGDRSKPHPLSRQWARRGLHLPSGNWDVQLEAARAHPWSWYTEQRELELGAEVGRRGNQPRCALQQSAEDLTGIVEPELGLRTALRRLGLGVTPVLHDRLVGYFGEERS